MNFILKLTDAQKQRDSLSWNDLTLGQRNIASKALMSELTAHKMGRHKDYSDSLWKSIINKKHYLLEKLRALKCLNIEETNEATGSIFIMGVGNGYYTIVMCCIDNYEFLNALAALTTHYPSTKVSKVMNRGEKCLD